MTEDNRVLGVVADGCVRCVLSPPRSCLRFGEFRKTRCLWSTPVRLRPESRVMTWKMVGEGDGWELIRPGEQDRTFSVLGMVETLGASE